MHDDRMLWLLIAGGAVLAVATFFGLSKYANESVDIETGHVVSVPSLDIDSGTVVSVYEETTSHSSNNKRRRRSTSRTEMCRVEFHSNNPPSVARHLYSNRYDVRVPTSKVKYITDGPDETEYVSHEEEEATEEDFDNLGGLIEVEMRRMQGLPDPPPPIVDVEFGVEVVGVVEKEKADGGLVYVVNMVVGGSPTMFVTENADVVEFLRERSNVNMNISEVNNDTSN